MTYHPSKRQVSSTSVTTPPSSPPSSSSSPIPLSTPSPVSDPSKSLSQSPPVMSAEARRQLEREMAVQRADHITSEQYVESRYRASSWGSRNDASSQSSSRRNTFGPTRSTFRRERDRVRRGDNHRDESRNMRTMGLHDIELDNEDDFERYGQTGAAFRTDPSIFEEILQESRIQTDVDEINQDGMSLQQLEEMMIREVILSFVFSYLLSVGYSNFNE